MLTVCHRTGQGKFAGQRPTFSPLSPTLALCTWSCHFGWCLDEGYGNIDQCHHMWLEKNLLAYLVQ